MKVIFMGTPDFAVATLNELASAGHQILAVVTQPDRPKGRGKKLAPPPVKERALELDLEVYQPTKVKDPEFIELLRGLNADVIVVVAYGRILPKEILEMPRYGCLNVHASLLPAYRGAAPIHWAVINGEKETGVTIMQMDEGLDTGDMLLKEALPIGNDDTTGYLFEALADIGGRLLVQTLELIEKGECVATKQDDTKATYASMIHKEHEIIDWQKSAVEIRNQIRGMNPFPGAYTLVNGERLKVWRTELCTKEYNGQCGAIVDIDENGFIVQTGQGSLRLVELQPAGKKKMSARDLMNGSFLTVGSILGEVNECR